MREIKFRAWNKSIGKMEEDVCINECGEVIHFDYGEYAGVTDDIVMQYTGLKDKNGTEIYEGDILTDHGDEGPLYVEYSNEHAAFVFVDKFDPFGTTSYTTLQISYEQFEIIGNIYENPELLEVD